MKADTTKLSAEVAVQHGASPRPDGGRCWGGTAKVVEVHAQTFVARCACGWRFAGMHTAGYNAPERG